MLDLVPTCTDIIVPVPSQSDINWSVVTVTGLVSPAMQETMVWSTLHWSFVSMHVSLFCLNSVLTMHRWHGSMYSIVPMHWLLVLEKCRLTAWGLLKTLATNWIVEVCLYRRTFSDYRLTAGSIDLTWFSCGINYQQSVALSMAMMGSKASS